MEALAQDENAKVPWEEVMAAAAVLCGNHFSRPPDAAALAESGWLVAHEELDPITGEVLAVMYTVRDFSEALQALGFDGEQAAQAAQYLAGLHALMQPVAVSSEPTPMPG